jgi:hypothetical protein
MPRKCFQGRRVKTESLPRLLGARIYTSQFELNANILPPPVVGEGWGGGGERQLTLPPPS